MDILYQHILPLFIEKPTISLLDEHVGKLIPVEGSGERENSYSIVVSLEQVFNDESIKVTIPSDKPFEFEIPANYFEVCLTEKGYDGGDVDIQVINRRHPKFLRIGSVDLLTVVADSSQTVENLDGSEISLEGDRILLKIPGCGLPIPGRHGERGNLFVIRDKNLKNTEDEEDEGSAIDWRLWLEVLNMHENANQVNLVE